MLRGIDDPSVLIVCGGGNNGGDGLAVARHLHNCRVRVGVALAVDPNTYRGESAVNWQVVESMELQRLTLEKAREAAARKAVGVIVDALFGTGLSTPPRSTEWISFMNGAHLPILAVDLPSGLDCDKGTPLGTACVRATRTVTFVAEKVGFANPTARQYLGQVTVGDIGCPRELIEAVARA
jgi:NAD(P)H-hydrate epimerase